MGFFVVAVKETTDQKGEGQAKILFTHINKRMHLK